MAYAKRYVGGFVNGDNSRQVDDTFLNAVEAALLSLFDANPASAGMVPVWTPAGTHYVPQLLTNASIDPAAAIAKSKLAALNIGDADVAGAAGIAKSKLALAGSLTDADINAAAAIALSKLADPGAGKVIGSVGAGAVAVVPPGTEIVYFAYTANQTTASTTLVDLVTFSAATYENTKYYLEIAIPDLHASISNDYAGFRLMEGASRITSLGQVGLSATANQDAPVFLRLPFTATAGSHTYKVQWNTAFAATITLAAASGDATFRIVKA